ncbi:MAG: HAMP domain-containing protein [Epsilonproteobacteria bacterium]|nr:HAMP domain-containing protein [Campylobacterota bacterium]
MKNISITAFINMIFSIALIIMGITIFIFIASYKEDKKSKDILKLKFLSETLAYNLAQDPPTYKINKFFNDFNLEPIELEKARRDIEDRGKTIIEVINDYGRAIVRVFEVDGKYYIYVDMIGYNYLLVDKSGDKAIQIAFVVGSIFFVLLVAIYIMLLKKVTPLKRLNKKIEQFAQGNLDIKINDYGSDEIGKIASSFDKAIKHIRQLINSKNLFMRNIMHELRTPITTSRIIAETVEDERAKGALIRSIDRMNELIEELAQIERITMYSFVPVKDNYSLEEILEESKKMLLKDEKHFEFRYPKDLELFTDKSLLALILKNLIDNAIKYSPDRFAKVEVVGNKILVKSKGERLKYDLSYYTEPFSQEEKRSTGFGLGLYIVSNISEKLGYKFRYRYDKQNSQNIFEIVIEE